MRRPSGVIATCILLGVAAVLLLMMAVVSLFTLAIIGHIPIPVPAQPGQPAPDPAMMSGVLHAAMIVSALFYAALAAWATATVVGLVRMRTWARYSVIAIGGGLALVGIGGAMSIALIQAFLRSTALPPGENPVFFHIVMILVALFYLAIAGIGIWWLVYFSLRKTRAAFALARTPQTAPAVLYTPPPSPYAASTYGVASYIPEPVELPTAAPILLEPAVAPAIVVDLTPAARPLAISIIGWLLIACGVLCLPFALLPFPIFLCGTVIAGAAAHIAMLCMAAISALTGIGLLRLERIALYAACAFYGFGILNTAILALPSTRDRMAAYQQDLMQKFSMGTPLPPMFDTHTMGLMMLPGIFFGVALCVVAIVFLLRSRAAFDRPAYTAAV